MIIAVGNDNQFRKLCTFGGQPQLGEDPRFLTNPLRLANRDACDHAVASLTKTKTQAHWVEGLARLAVPCSPVNRIDQVFADPQVQARGMTIRMHHTASGVEIPILASPIKMSATPPAYHRAPPVCGQHTDEVLQELLGLGAAELDALRARGAVS